MGGLYKILIHAEVLQVSESFEKDEVAARSIDINNHKDRLTSR